MDSIFSHGITPNVKKRRRGEKYYGPVNDGCQSKRQIRDILSEEGRPLKAMEIIQILEVSEISMP